MRQSVWHKHITTPKTEEAAKPVPVIEPLKGILADRREADGNPTCGPILRGPSGKPLNLDNLSKRVLLPLLQENRVARMVQPTTRCGYYARQPEPRSAGFEGPATAFEPCDHAETLHQRRA